jgi:hypothetical protein
MIKKIFINLPVIALLFLCGRMNAHSPSITATGSVSMTITSADLQSGAGSDLTSFYESNPASVTVAVSGAASLADEWLINVHKTDSTWHNNFHLYIRRASGEDLPTGHVHEPTGTTYQEVTGSDQYFFDGSGNITAVQMQFKVSDVSVQIPPANYQTTITYTVVDI